MLLIAVTLINEHCYCIVVILPHVTKDTLSSCDKYSILSSLINKITACNGLVIALA